MKKLLALMAAITAASAGHALAASSVELRAKGSITPSACMPLLANGGTVDYGKISASDLKASSNTLLPVARLQLSVSCEAPTLVAVKSQDNRAGTSAEYDAALPNFGLGLAPGNVKIGWYTLKMTHATADELPALLIESMDGQTWLDAPENTIWQPNWMRTVNGASAVAPAPRPLMSMKMDVVVASTITHRKLLPVGVEIPIDGSATLDVIYL